MICTPCIYGIPCGFYTVCTAHDKQFDSLTAPRNCVMFVKDVELSLLMKIKKLQTRGFELRNGIKEIEPADEDKILELTGELRAVEAQIKELEECLT